MTTENFTMEIPANFNRFVSDTLNQYKANGPRMLVAMFYATVVQIAEHQNTTKLQAIYGAVRSGADKYILTALVGKMVEGVSFTKEGTIKLAKEVKVNPDECAIILRAMNSGTTFRNKEFLNSLGLRVGKVTPFDLTKSTEAYVKNVLKEGVPVEVALQALKNAFEKTVTKDARDGSGVVKNISQAVQH